MKKNQAATIKSTPKLGKKNIIKKKNIASIEKSDDVIVGMDKKKNKQKNMVKQRKVQELTINKQSKISKVKTKVSINKSKKSDGVLFGKISKKDTTPNRKKLKVAVVKPEIRKVPLKISEPLSFSENQFNEIVSVETVMKVAKALIVQVKEEVSKKKTSIFEDYRYYLDVSAFKIASCPKRMVKLSLKHPLVEKTDDILVVVPDLQRGAKIDYEPTIQHYEDLFRNAGVEGLTIMPFNQMRNEYNTFEAVRKLANTYDHFLVDGRIAGLVVGFCGKIFQKPRTTFHALHLSDSKKIFKEVEKGLHRTAYKQLAKGDLISIPVGNDKFSAKQLAENIVYVTSQLKTIYPGGLANVRGMYLKLDITGTSSLPIYVSISEPPSETPNVIGPRERRLMQLKKQARDLLSKFDITKNAELVGISKEEIKRRRKLKETRAVLADPITEELIEKDVEEDVDFIDSVEAVSEGEEDDDDA